MAAGRLARLTTHLGAPAGRVAASADAPCAAARPVWRDRVRDLQQYTSKGVVTVTPGEMGVAAAAHGRLYVRVIEAVRRGEDVSYETVPELVAMMSAPGIVAALDNILGGRAGRQSHTPAIKCDCEAPTSNGSRSKIHVRS